MKNLRTFSLILFIFTVMSSPLMFGQTFTKIEDSSNPIVSTQLDNNYSGAAWVDYDNDGDLDLHTSKNFLFQNNGSDIFELVNTIIGLDQSGQANGISWGDVDNDGDLDCFLAGIPSVLYLNNGAGQFEKVETGDIAIGDKRGWTAAWADYNIDGFLDLIVTHPAGFVGQPVISNQFYDGNGDGRFTERTDFEFTEETAPYTVASWSDYDLDGDLDLFIASGPAVGSPERDYLYKNLKVETGTADLERISESPIGTDKQDGQVYNWIDFDNDGDLDLFLTNYGGQRDRFYENEGGIFSEVINALTIEGNRLANTWGDLDNDGDLDVVITSESQNYYYRNNGDGTFTEVENAISQSGSSRGAVLGDYDNDGDLDLFVSGSGDAKGLFRNDTENENNWLSISLKGTVSNKSAIGARVMVKANINDEDQWLIREISTQNSFNSHNSLRLHFGLGDAASVDSLKIFWPSGEVDEFGEISSNQFLEFTEEIPQDFFRVNFKADKITDFGSITVNFEDISLTDPANPVTSWQWDFNNDGTIDASTQNPSFTYSDVGVYTVKLTASNGKESKTLIREDYIEVKREPGIPVIQSFSPSVQDTTIGKSGKIEFSVEAVDTTDYPISYTWIKNGTALAIDENTYNYRSTIIFPTPRTDTIKVVVSNGFNQNEIVWYVHVEDPVSVSDEKGNFPRHYSLSQNYPNPFNPATKIKFTIPGKNSSPKVVKTTLTVYDILGNEITTLVNEELSSGYYEVDFNAENLSSGVFIYRIKSGNYSNVRKMILLK